MPLLAPCRPRPSSTAPCAAAWVRTRHRATKAVSADRARSGDNGPRYARSIEATISRCSIAAFPRPRARCRSTWNKELPMRTFIALDLPPDFADDAAALARRLSASMEGRFLKRDTYHLTLAFLGDVDEAQLAAATDALEAACAGASPVPLRSDGLGKFGRATDATLWLGIAAAPELEQLATSCVPATCPSMPSPSKRTSPSRAALASRTSACRTWRFPKTTRRTTSPFTRARSTARAPLTSRCTQCASEPSQPSVPSPLPPAGRGSPCGRTGRGSRRGRSSVRAPTWSSPQAPRWSCRRP